MIKLMPSLRLLPGFALDLTEVDPFDQQPWDFDRADKRERARALVVTQRPMFLIGSPACSAFSSWQALNAALGRDKNGLAHRDRLRAEVHLRFCCELYALQVEHGRYFLHEHPTMATSWGLPCIREVLQLNGVDLTRTDQCQFGQIDVHGGQ